MQLKIVLKELAGYEFVQVELNNDERKMIESNIWNVIFSIAKVCVHIKWFA